MGRIDIDINKPLIVLNVVIAGRFIETARMALDTGATNVMIPWRLAKSLGLKPEISEEKTEIITASGTEIAQIVTLKSVKVLGKDAKKYQGNGSRPATKKLCRWLIRIKFFKKL